MKKLFLFGLFTLLSILSARADDFEVDGIYYNIISGTDQVEVTSGSVNYSGSLVIPATVMHNGITYRVTSIGDDAFSGCRGLTSVEIPNSVTTIGGGAFFGGGLLEVYYTGDIAQWCGICFGERWMGNRTYGYCDWDLYIDKKKVVDMVIPESVTSIGKRAFSYCRGLVSVTILNGVTYIMEGDFYNCSGLRSVILPRNLEVIAPSAFAGCTNLISVTCKAPIPPRIGYYDDEDEDGEDEFIETTQPVFSNYYSTLYVPYGYKNDYQSAQEWYKFSKIEELPSAGTATVTLRANDASMGTVIGGGIYHLDEQVTLAAIPHQGYYFARWDDGKTANPRILMVTGDTTLTAVFAKNETNPDDPGNPGGTTANEAALSAAPFAYVQGRTAYLSDGLGEVEAFTATGQRVYRGFDRSVTLPHPGVYILRVVADGRRCKVAVK